MDLSTFKSILEETQIPTVTTGVTTSIPVAYWAFPEKEAPPLPFICFFEDGSSNFPADNRVYSGFKRVSVELYSRYKDEVTEASLEAVLAKHDLPWEKSETHLDDENCYEVIYQMEV